MELLSVWHTFLSATMAPSTVEAYFGATWRFFGAVRVPVEKITEQQIAEWIETFPFRSSRRTTYFHGLRSFFSWAVRNEHIAKDPTAAISVAAPEEKEPRALTVEQYEAVKAAAYNRDLVRGYAVELLYYSGGRIGEVVRLTWDNVTSEGIIFTKTKGGRERLIPWSPGLKRAVDGLRSRFGEQGRVLPRAEQTVWAWMRDAGRDAGVPRVHPHLFRATAATRIQQRGGMPTSVQHLLGHRKLVTTQRYLQTDRQDIAKAVQLL